jgi:magnesium transporter
MFKVLDFDGEGRATPHEGNVDEFVRPPPAGQTRFVDCLASTPEERALLQERFAFHPVAIEDCAEYDVRARVEPYDDHVFVVVHALRPDPEDPGALDARELHAFLSAGYLVLVHDQPMEQIDAAWRRLAQEPLQVRRGPAYIFYLITDATTAAVFPWIEDIIDRIETAEDDLLDKPSAKALHVAFAIRHLLASIRRVLAPQWEVFATVGKLEGPIVGKKLAPYYRSVHDEVLRLTDLVETARDHVSNLREAHTAAMSQRTNAIVHRLTALSAVFLPLTFLTGYFGQNFEALPFGSRALFFAALGLTVLTPTAMMLWFRRRGWW